MLYALAAYEAFNYLCDFAVIEMHIHQPRRYHHDTHTVSIVELLEFKEQVKVAYAATLSSSPKFVPGKSQCQWCKAKTSCKALGDYVQASTQVDSLPLSEAMARVDLVKGWVKAVEDKVFSDLSSGLPVDGYKLVPGRSMRKWSSEAEVEKLLRKKKIKVSDIFSKKLVSVAQAEKLLGKDKFQIVEALVFKPAGKPTIAESSDPRGAVDTSGFEDITEV